MRKSAIGRRYTWRRDLPDHRDLAYIPPTVPGRPTKVDLTKGCSPVEDQGQLGSCTANSLSGACEFLEDRDGVPFKDTSRLFIYYNERMIEGDINQDNGAQIRDGVKSLAKYGAADEALWPYVTTKFRSRPPTSVYADAASRKISKYGRIVNIDDMLNCLAEGFPFVFGFTVYSAFESELVARTGNLNMPKKGESVVGGHAVLAVGYNDTTKRVLVRNSWGASWGKKGYFTMPYKYISDQNLADDMWTIRAGSEL